MGDIDINKEFETAIDILENTDKNVFIQGRAGTGKSTLLEYFRSITRKNVAVLAPTGVSAVNVKGSTIHSFFRFKPDITPDKVKTLRPGKRSRMYKNIDIIIIDEVSMVRADLMDSVDIFLRKNGRSDGEPFGGVQMAFFGDLYQLPPVVSRGEKGAFRAVYESPYFFGSNVFQGLDYELVDLEKVYRQKDEKFIKILNAIRNNKAGEKELAVLNERVVSNSGSFNDDEYVYLVPTNNMAFHINERKLALLDGQPFVNKGELGGDISGKYLPTEEELRVKTGAKVMLLNNDPDERWVNGTIGKILSVRRNLADDLVVVELENGRTVELPQHRWDLYRFKHNKRTGKLESEVAGYFVQYPIKLAWAVTIHKSQGKTFDKILLDTGSGIFAAGQVYVALSRARTLEGVALKKSLRLSDIKTDGQVFKFMTKLRYEKSEEKMPLDEKKEMIQKAIDDNLILEIAYLKLSDEKTRRVVKPVEVGEMNYKNNIFVGMKAMIANRGDKLITYRVDRILSIEVVMSDVN